MNIQPSVIIWTVICFSLMMLVLDRLLFRPVLAVLDSRRERLTEARQKKADMEKQITEQRERCEMLRLERAEQKNAHIQQALEQIQAKEKTVLKDAHRECLLRIDVYREQREKELEEILTAVSPKMAEVAEMFAERVASDND